MDFLPDRPDRWEFLSYSRLVGGPRETNLSQKIELDSFAYAFSDIPWIHKLSSFARSGILQIIVLALSVVWLAANLVTRPRRFTDTKIKASSIRWPYEVLSQAARATSLAFFALAFIHGESNVINLVVLSYAFVLGLARLANQVHWRHVALHHVNFVMTAMLLISILGNLLPCIQAEPHCVVKDSLIGAISSLAAAFFVAINTPREWVPPQIEYDIPGYKHPEEPALEETCSWLNYYWTYEWLSPVIWKGAKGQLDMDGIPRLAWYDEPLYLLRKVQKAREIAGSTFWTTMRFLRVELSLMATWIGLAFIVENVAPFGMYMLLAYIANPEGAIYQPWLWLLMTFSGPLIRSFFFQQYVFTSTRLIVRVKSAMTQELYHKALESMELEDDPFEIQGKDKPKKDGNATKTTSAGRLANLMAADVDAIYRSRDIVMVCIGVTSGTIISLVGLYALFSWIAVVGIVVLLLAIPSSTLLGKAMFHAQRRVRVAQDGRISLVTEYLASIKAIKYFAWENAFTEKIVGARANEQKQQWSVSVLQIFLSQFTQIIPNVALLVIFGLHVGVTKKRLDASTAFTTIYLVNNIRRNIMMAGAFARSFSSAMVSFGRLDKYFASTVPMVKYPEGPLLIKDASFRRNKKATFSLEDISFDFVEGGLNVVSGQSGSGKSTLLYAILGETYLEGGSVTRPADVAFASQSAWLQNDTVKANILFSSPFEQVRYDKVIEACCLAVDFSELAEGELTTVGENGTSLSGGQKARVALARALYSKAPVLLLDDIFSALDAKTAAGVWKYCFCNDLLKGRTVVLVTQLPWIAEQGDLSVTLEKGRIISLEQNIGVVRKPLTIAQVLGGDDDDEDTKVQSTPEPELQPNGDAVNDITKVAQEAKPKDIVNQEMKASGRVGRMTFVEYMGYFGHPLFALSIILGLLCANITSFGGSYWLSIWVDAYENKAHIDAAFYLGIFAVFTFGDSIWNGFLIIMFEWGAWRAGKQLHNDFIRAVMRVSISWFKVVPVGRITNRFSSDMSSIDGMLSYMLRATLDAFMNLIFRVLAISSIMPIFMLPALFTCGFGIVIGELYTRTAVIIKRLTSSAQSPVFSQFADTLAGLPVIRARQGMAQAFTEELAEKLRAWSASSEANYNANRWVAVRVDAVTALVGLCAGIIALSQTGLVAAGLVGFSLSNANGLNQTILMLVRAMNDLEVEMQSFHRVKEYVKLESEEKDDKPYPEEGEYTDDPSHIIPESWPRSGEIEFRNVTIRYDEDGPDILTDVNLKFKSGERVAVVGRTGSGKSTLLLSLLRFTHVVSGEILYDGIDITKVPRQRLRGGLTIIPQEAVLFNGNVESNLDPTGLMPKEVLTRALDNCRGIASFSDRESSNEGSDGEHGGTGAGGITLTSDVEAKGENFSHGQRQVLSLCRALIRQSKLMLLDEATASMDYETDKEIQRVLREELELAGGDRTLVTIAHRLRTIADYDVIVVMSAGKVVEFGPPKDLFEAKGQFYDMVFHSGEMEQLEEIMNQKK